MGVGGVGKTRVALRVARDVRRSVTDGVAWVELADLRDPALLPQTVEDALSVSDKTGREPLSNLANHLRDRNALIALDNAEHVLEPCAALITHLLRAAPNLRFLVTSRQALGVPGERLLSLAPLLVPDETGRGRRRAIAYPSIVLFAERAAASIPGFVVDADNQEAVAAICRAVEGIPLAIELATVRLRVLSVGELAHRLDDRLEVLGAGRRSFPPDIRPCRPPLIGATSSAPQPSSCSGLERRSSRVASASRRPKRAAPTPSFHRRLCWMPWPGSWTNPSSSGPSVMDGSASACSNRSVSTGRPSCWPWVKNVRPMIGTLPGARTC